MSAKKFSKVSSLLNLLCIITVMLSFENFHQIALPLRYFLLAAGMIVPIITLVEKKSNVIFTRILCSKLDLQIQIVLPSALLASRGTRME